MRELDGARTNSGGSHRSSDNTSSEALRLFSSGTQHMNNSTPRKRSRFARRLSWLAVASLTSAALFAPGAASVRAAAPNPTYEFGAPGITVDGIRTDWAAADFFAEMYRAGKDEKVVESNLYLRYNCTNEKLYVMVATVPGVVLADEDDFVKINGAKQVGSPNIDSIVVFMLFTASSSSASKSASLCLL